MKTNFESTEIWMGAGTLSTSLVYVCGYCNEKVASAVGYVSTGHQQPQQQQIRICPNCKGPTFFDREYGRYPGSVPGNPVKGLPVELEALYTEARNSAAAGAHTPVCWYAGRC